MKKIIINNVYSFRNRGDSAIIEAMAKYFTERFPKCEILLASTFWKDNSDYYNHFGYTSIPSLCEIPMHNNKVIRLFLAVSSFLNLLFACCVHKKVKECHSTLDHYRAADLIIDAGGGSFFSSNKYFFYLGFYQHLFNLWAAKRMGKTVFIAPQSMGPFNKKHDIFWFKRICKKLDKVMVREQISKDLLDALNVPSELVPDCAFMNNFTDTPSETCKESIKKINPNTINIGMTVLDWSWAITDKRDNACSHYLQTIAESLSEISKKYTISVHLFSQTDVATERSDYEVAGELKELLIHKNINCIQHSPENTASDLCHLYRQMTIFIGSRMHSCIFAVNQSIPVIALAYQPKTTGVLNWVSAELKILPINTFTSFELKSAILDTINHRNELSQSIFNRCLELNELIRTEFNRAFGK